MSNEVWENKIVGYELVSADDLLANPMNARKHPAKQRVALRASLDTLGFVAPILVNRNTNFVIDGHARIEEALSKNDNMMIPVLYVDLTENEEKQFLATFDAITYLAEYDSENLLALMKSIDSDNEDIQRLLADMAQEQGIVLDEPNTLDAEPQINLADELQKKWQTERGQVWEIPSKSGNSNHRVMCGDSTSAEDVARLMDGKRAGMMFTDPPYGVSYEGGHFHSGDVNIKRTRENLSGDTSTVLYHLFLPVFLPYIDGACYMWFADSQGLSVYQALHDNKCEVHALIIWNKINATYAAMNAQYKQRHEPCLYFKSKGKTLRWVGESTEATIWEIKRDSVNEFHPTQKPTELAKKAILNHENGIVVDAFLGSGSTLIACEQTGRTGYGMEISPAYVAVCLQRLSDIGLTPHLTNA